MKRRSEERGELYARRIFGKGVEARGRILRSAMSIQSKNLKTRRLIERHQEAVRPKETETSKK